MSQKGRPRSRSRSGGGELVLGPGLLAGLIAVVALTAGLTWFLLDRTGGAVPGDTPGEASPRARTVRHEPGTGMTPEGDPFIGAADAPVTIVEFSDYQCPNCRQFATEVLPWLRESWLAQGFVRVVFRDFAIRGERSVQAAHAAHCAGEQGRYWSYHDRIFEMAFGTEARPLDPENLAELAREMGLDLDAYAACTESQRHLPRIEASAALARQRGFQGTPTYLINGRQTRGAINIADWDQLFRLYQQDLGLATTVPGS